MENVARVLHRLGAQCKAQDPGEGPQALNYQTLLQQEGGAVPACTPSLAIPVKTCSVLATRAGQEFARAARPHGGPRNPGPAKRPCCQPQSRVRNPPAGGSSPAAAPPPGMPHDFYAQLAPTRPNSEEHRLRSRHLGRRAVAAGAGREVALGSEAPAWCAELRDFAVTAAEHRAEMR